MFVIGTAGHVDHGKSTLVKALTGINPDRLREEQERQMTIDLGFAWMTMPSGRQVSIVDVPGHEDFIRNMLAGIGGIDVAMLVVAADESVMPQTREHLAILDLLQIPKGVVALTKSDLVEDQEWLELVVEEVRQELRGTVLADAALIPVSSTTGAGLRELTAELDRLLDDCPARPDLHQPRLPIDRVFTISGFGTIVTGTLLDGHLTIGDEVEILPGEVRARIRGLQTHRTQVRDTEPGARVAVNLSGVAVDQLRRGQVLATPNSLNATTLVDARLRLLPKVPWPLKHRAPLEFFSGAARSEASVRLLDVEELAPGDSAWVQFVLSEPLVVKRGDRFIARLASPNLTLGGGEVVQPHPQRLYRRFRPEVIAHLEALARGTPEDIVIQVLAQRRLLEVGELLAATGLPEGEAAAALRALVRSNKVVALGSGDAVARDPAAAPAVAVMARHMWEELVHELQRVLGGFHERAPLRDGMPREEVKSRLGLEAPLLNQVLEYAGREGIIAATSTSVRLASFQPTLAQEQQRRLDAVLAQFERNPYTPPASPQVEEAVGADVLQFALEQGILVKVAEGVLFTPQALADMERRVVEHLRTHAGVTVAEVRDLLGTSRKYALGLLEDLDRRHVTKRLGDLRVLRSDGGQAHVATQA